MNPVGILRFSASDGQGYLGEFLADRGINHEVIAVDRGEAVPDRVQRYSGFALMGGPMSAYDDLPWISPVLSLIRNADAAGLPCLGHCLGGQLMARAFGGSVVAHTHREIGWFDVQVDTQSLRQWGAALPPVVTVFQWHADTFSIPPGATRVMSNRNCTNQAFVMGPHLGLQCHIEMTSKMVDAWCAEGYTEIERHAVPSVQSVSTIQTDASHNLPRLHETARTIYTAFTAKLRREGC